MKISASGLESQGSWEAWGGDSQNEGRIPMGTDSSPKWNAKVVIPLGVFGVAQVKGAGGVGGGGTLRFNFIAPPEHGTQSGGDGAAADRRQGSSLALVDPT